jgi:hypothetical protein
MKIHIILLFALIAISTSAIAQVAINTNNSAPDSSAMLDIQSSASGLLIPRMTTAQRTGINNPANALMVYQTDGTSGFYYFNGAIWQRIGEADGSETKVTAGTNVTVTGTGTSGNPYVINATGGGGISHYIGELFGGGIVFWVDNTGQHGLVASLVDMSNGTQWSALYTITGAISTWNGSANTTTILGVSQAAQLCDNYINSNYGTGIFSDWYLPAIDQLTLIYHSRYSLNKEIEAIPGAAFLGNQYYWSSAENGSSIAWAYSFGDGYPFSDGKHSNYWVRAVRSF